MEQRKSRRVAFARGYDAQMMAIDGTWRKLAYLGYWRSLSPDLVHRMIAIALTSAKTALNAAHNQRPRMERPLSGGFSLREEWRKCLENSDRNCLRVKYFARGRSDVVSLPTALATWSSRSNSMHFRKNMKATRSGQKPEVAPVDAITHPASADGLFQCRQLTFEPSQPARIGLFTREDRKSWFS